MLLRSKPGAFLMMLLSLTYCFREEEKDEKGETEERKKGEKEE